MGFEITSEQISDVLGYVGETFDGVSALFFLLVGILFGLWIIDGIVGIIRDKKAEK